MVAGNADMAVVMIYELLKQYYYDAGCFPKNMIQSIYKSFFKSVPHFSHVQI